MQDYVTSHFHVEESSSDSCAGEKTEGVDASIDDVVSFIMARKSGNPRFRGPMLALIELRTRLVAKRSSGASDDQVCELLVEYFDTFGSKAVCASDLKLFLPTMEESHIQQFFQRALQTIKFDEAGVPVDMDHVQKHVCWHQMKRLVGSHNFDTTVEARSKLAEALCGQYDACLPMIRYIL